MALKICRFVLERSPVNQSDSFNGAQMNMMFALQDDILIKKISLNAVYISSNNNTVIKDYNLIINLLHKDRITLRNNPYILVNPINFLNNTALQYIELNKKSPIKNINQIFGGFRIANDNNVNMGFLLNNSPSVNDKIQYLLTVYYE